MKLLFCLIIVKVCISQVDLNYYLPLNQNYNPTILKPADVIGYEIGDWHLRPDQIDAYFWALAKQSDRVQFIKTGKTHEDRQLILLIISSPKNLANLEAIKSERKQLQYPDVSNSVNLENMPAIVWLGNSVHGNEPSGANSAPLTAYHFAALQGNEIEQILDKTVILIDPHNNPDGLNRFATWANMHKSKNLVADPMNREHRENWPGGRTNHYWFDLNRDWMPLQHPESQARVAQYHDWLPNILTDHHEMGTNSTFFFEPVHKNRFNQMTPKRTYDITTKIAEYHRQTLDEIGSFYYTKESYDDFYVGYGSSYPDITGGIGLLFEQASSRGHLQESIHGDLSFPFTIRNQFRTALSTIKAAYNMRLELNQHIRTFFRESFEMAEEDDDIAYLLGSNDEARNNLLADLLMKHQIEVYSLKQDTRLYGYTYKTNRDLIIPLKQKQYRLLVSLFKNHLSFADSSFYDISTWNLAHSFNMKFDKIDDDSRLNDIIGKPFSINHQTEITGISEYAYLIRWDSYNSFRAIQRLLSKEVIIKVAERGFSINKQNYPAGTILVPMSLQIDKKEIIEEIRNQIRIEDKIQFDPIHSGFTEQGIDLGSGNFSVLKNIKAMILSGSGTSSYDIGEIWHLTDTRLNLPLTIVETGYINSMNLNDYNVIILSSGNYNEINETGIKQIGNWVKQGGTLITLSNANRWLKQKKFVNFEFKIRERINKDNVIIRRDYEKAEAYSAAANIGGSIFMTDLDLSHPIGFGFETRDLPYLKRGNTIIQPLDNPYNTPLIFKSNSLLAGYISKVNQKNVEGSAAISIIGSGKGRIIAFADNPNFRSFWYGTNRLFMNALIFGQIINSPSF